MSDLKAENAALREKIAELEGEAQLSDISHDYMKGRIEQLEEALREAQEVLYDALAHHVAATTKDRALGLLTHIDALLNLPQREDPR